MKCLVTGGAGFIGSHIVDRVLTNGDEVVIYDRLSDEKKLFFIKHNLDNKNCTVIKGDVLDTGKLTEAMKGVDFVFHIASHADARSGFADHSIDHVQNLEATRSVLEAMYKNGVKKIAFASSAHVYGAARVHPTPESYSLEPTSLYGASKAASEHYIQAYASYYDWQTYIFRLGPFFGERHMHGIIYDVVKKIKKNPSILEIFSDGTPKRAPLYVGDGVDAMFTIINSAHERFNIFNIGNDEVLTVNEMVNLILKAAKVKSEKKYLRGESGRADTDFIYVDTQKLKQLGWRPKVSIAEGIKRTVAYLESNPQLLE
jgi:UDP-glucose 4-epimerase